MYYQVTLCPRSRLHQLEQSNHHPFGLFYDSIFHRKIERALSSFGQCLVLVQTFVHNLLTVYVPLVCKNLCFCFPLVCVCV